jgi:hypothetical protein
MWEIAATGAIRRDPKYAGRAEMKQVLEEPLITRSNNAKALPMHMSFARKL